MLVLGVVLLINLGMFVGAFSADSYYFTSDFNCVDYGIQCGSPRIIYPNGTIFDKSCGECSSDKTCYNGKCINAGICERPVDFNTDCASFLPLSNFYTPGQSLQTRLENYERECNLYGCNYNSQTQKCTGVLPSCSDFMKKNCEYEDNRYNQEGNSNFGNFDCVWNEDAESCFCAISSQAKQNSPWLDSYYVNKLGLCPGHIGGDKAGCKLSNLEQYDSIFLVYKDSSFPSIRDDGANMILLSNDELESIQEGETISMVIKMTNTGIPKDSPIVITIYAWRSGDLGFKSGYCRYGADAQSGRWDI